MNDKLRAMRELALRNETFRLALLATQSSTDALSDFCSIAADYGFALTPGELISDGEEFSSNQTKSTNGGNPLPYDFFDDPYEMFLISITR